MANVEIKNAKIMSLTISNGDHGLLSSYLHLEYGDGSEQGFGGYALYCPNNKDGGHRDVTGLFIWRVLEMAGVYNISDLDGQIVRVQGSFNKIHAIGHILEDKWFTPSEEFAAIGEE